RGEVEDGDEDGEQIVVRHPGRREQRDQQQHQQREAARLRALGEPRDHTRLPRMPCGRNSSTNTSRPKENMLLADGVNSRPAIASGSPIGTPRMRAPGIEPSPPVMTMMKASKVSAGPSAGVTSTSSTSMAPAAPTQAAPMPKVSA